MALWGTAWPRSYPKALGVVWAKAAAASATASMAAKVVAIVLTTSSSVLKDSPAKRGLPSAVDSLQVTLRLRIAFARPVGD